MKKLTLSLAAISASLLAAPFVAIAAPWQSINQRQANLDRRIDMGVRNGSLTRPEARRLRNQFANLNRLEWVYRRSGNRLTSWERSDLNRRFDMLSRAVRTQRHDWQRRR